MTPPRLLRILHAGSLDRLVRDDLIPLFERRARCSCESLSGSSRALARAIRDGSAHADVFLSADAEVIETELSGTGDRSLVDTCVVFATNAMVVALSDAGPHAALARKALAGGIGLVELLQAGLRIGRPDPDEDPKGYRTLFALQLLERHAGAPGLAPRLLGPPRNPDQIFPVPALIPMLRRGEIELLVTYRSHVVEEGLPFLELPPEANLEPPDLADHYATATHRCADGTLYCGSPISYAAAALTGGAAARREFVRFLGEAEARRATARHGFTPTWRMVGSG
jgi:molybdate/tungstate transport system substrate-binding protein